MWNVIQLFGLHGSKRTLTVDTVERVNAGEWDVMWDSHLCGRGRYVGFVPASSILPQFAASATHILVSILTVNRYTYPGLLLLLYIRRQ